MALFLVSIDLIHRDFEFPKILQEAIAYFSGETRALDFMVSKRWPSGKVSGVEAMADLLAHGFHEFIVAAR